MWKKQTRSWIQKSSTIRSFFVNYSQTKLENRSYAQFSKNPLTQGLKPKDWDIFYLVGNHRLKYSVIIIGARGPGVFGPMGPRAPREFWAPRGFWAPRASGSKKLWAPAGLGVQRDLELKGPRAPSGFGARGAQGPQGALGPREHWASRGSKGPRARRPRAPRKPPAPNILLFRRAMCY